MTLSIRQRCRRRETSGFVVPETVDLLTDRLLEVVGDRRMTLMHRYLGERPGTPRLFAGYRLWHGGLGEPVSITTGRGVSVVLRGPGQRSHVVGFRVAPHVETEKQARDRYDNPGEQWLGQRREITFVEVRGWPHEPHPEDHVRVEHWNENGLGEETIVAFDDMDPVEEIAWDVKGDLERHVHMWREFCDEHGLHFEHPDHQRTACTGRRSTRAEDLAILAYLDQTKEPAQ